MSLTTYHHSQRHWDKSLGGLSKSGLLAPTPALLSAHLGAEIWEGDERT